MTHFTARIIELLTPRNIAILVTILIATTLSRSIDSWLADWRLAHQPLPHKKSAPVISSEELIQRLGTANLFGQLLQEKTSSLPVTSLPLQLTGIIQNVKNNDESKAIISIEGQPGKLFHIGDTLPMGITIHAITPTEVIFDNDGRLEKLVLPRKKNTSQGEVQNDEIPER